MTRTEKLARKVAAAGTKHWIEVGFGFLAVDAEVESAGEFEWMDGIFTVYVRFTGRIRKSGAVHPRGADATDKLFAVDTFELKG